METIIVTDSCSDLPIDYVKKRNLPILNFVFNFMGEDRQDDLGQSLSYSDFYEAVRKGQMPTTSQVNSQTYMDFFRKYIEKGKALIYMCFSSALSGSYNNALLAKDTLMEEYPQAQIAIVDTRSASLGQGLLVHHALNLLDEGKSFDEIISWIEKSKQNLAHWFTVDDLDHLKRGGRLSGAAAFIGTMLSIKPILHINNEGKLVPVSKVKGRKKSLRTLLDKMKETAIYPETQTIFISHGDSHEDAEYLASLVKKEFGIEDILINHIGPVIGSHSGPGTMALFFLANSR